VTHTLGSTPLEEGSARRRGLYVHNIQHSQDTHSHAPEGFEPTILVSERPQTHALDRTATGIGFNRITKAAPKASRYNWRRNFNTRTGYWNEIDGCATFFGVEKQFRNCGTWKFWNVLGGVCLKTYCNRRIMYMRGCVRGVYVGLDALRRVLLCPHT
jgi:hypothetical protein